MFWRGGLPLIQYYIGFVVGGVCEEFRVIDTAAQEDEIYRRTDSWLKGVLHMQVRQHI